MVEEDLLLKDWRPKSTLVLEEHIPEKAKFPAINVHTHLSLRVNRTPNAYLKKARALGRSRISLPLKQHIRRYRIDEVIKIMDTCNVEKIVDLDGVPPIKEYSKIYKDYPDRVIVFYILSFGDIDDSKYGEKRAAELEEAVSQGARGLKVFKELGLRIKDKFGRLVPVDDPRFDPVWEKAGELGVPVLIHTSDPASFFLPVDRFNPSYVTLRYSRPDWSFYGPQFPDKMELLKQRNNVIERHPKTIFIGAHQGNYPENLSYVSSLLDKYDNFYVEFSARITTLGLQPYTARRHFIKYQDRILFGTDGCPDESQYRTYFRFLETEDEYFDGRPWGERIYGINLPDDVLEKIYRKNAEKIIPKN
ncbi:TPA: amidohydrolase [Candidatus Bathyarchaeota archaeon]|nr:amidohydrolase [Candidatus Bathyarchaeota archaeon]